MEWCSITRNTHGQCINSWGKSKIKTTAYFLTKAPIRFSFHTENKALIDKLGLNCTQFNKFYH